MAQPLVVPRELQGFKDVQATISKAREQADRIPETIADRAQLGEATDALKALRDARKDAEATRKVEKAPFTDAGKRIDADFNELGATVQGAERSLEARIGNFEAAERKAHEEEQKRIEKNERERQKRENEKAEREQRNSRRVEPAPLPPPPPKGGRGTLTKAKATPKKVWKYEIVNEQALPDEYLTKTPNRKRIRAHVEAGVEVPGVRAWQETEYAVR